VRRHWKAATLFWATAHEDNVLGGVFDRGRHEEDDPGTWEAPIVAPERVGQSKGDRSQGRGRRGVGGLHKSEDAGERPTNRTQPSRRRPVSM
jgi:hypothetical protein